MAITWLLGAPATIDQAKTSPVTGTVRSNHPLRITPDPLAPTRRMTAAATRLGVEHRIPASNSVPPSSTTFPGSPRCTKSDAAAICSGSRARARRRIIIESSRSVDPVATPTSTAAVAAAQAAPTLTTCFEESETMALSRRGCSALDVVESVMGWWRLMRGGPEADSARAMLFATQRARVDRPTRRAGGKPAGFGTTPTVRDLSLCHDRGRKLQLRSRRGLRAPANFYRRDWLGRHHRHHRPSRSIQQPCAHRGPVSDRGVHGTGELKLTATVQLPSRPRHPHRTWAVSAGPSESEVRTRSTSSAPRATT